MYFVNGTLTAETLYFSNNSSDDGVYLSATITVSKLYCNGNTATATNGYGVYFNAGGTSSTTADYSEFTYNKGHDSSGAGVFIAQASNSARIIH